MSKLETVQRLSAPAIEQQKLTLEILIEIQQSLASMSARLEALEGEVSSQGERLKTLEASAVSWNESAKLGILQAELLAKLPEQLGKFAGELTRLNGRFKN
jgi:predicted nuclease with TOPRIM domain